MRTTLKTFLIGLVLTITAYGQSNRTFEVATVKPSPPMDRARMIASLQSGKMPYGADIDNGRAEYKYLDLKSLLTYAYGVKSYQITGPDWMATTRFDIVAKMPEGSTKDDAPQMLQSLLEERFKLSTHRTRVEHPVFALVTGKGGPKLNPSAEKPVAIDENEPLKPGETKMDGPDGPARVKVDLTTGSSVIDMGLKGRMSYRVAPASQTLRLEFSMTTMSGFADMLTQLFTQIGGGGGRQIIDMTEIKGNYDASLDLSLADIMAMVAAQGIEIPPVPTSPGTAADPDRGSSLAEAVQSMGLKLESRKAMVDQLIVDHVEKTPVAN